MPIHKHLRQRPVLETSATTAEDNKASFYRIPEISTTTSATGEPPPVYYSVSPTSSSSTTGTISPTSESSSSTATSLQVMAPDVAAARVTTLEQQQQQQEQEQQQAMAFAASHVTNPAVASTASFSTNASSSSSSSTTITTTNAAPAAATAVAPPAVLDPLQMLANLAAGAREHVPSSSSSSSPSPSTTVLAATTARTATATAPRPLAAPRPLVEGSSSSSWAVGKESLYNFELYNPTLPTPTSTTTLSSTATATATTIREVSNTSSILQVQQPPQREESWSIVPAPPPPPPPPPPRRREQRQHPLLESSPSFYEDRDEQQQQQHPLFLSTFSSHAAKISPRQSKPKKAKATPAVRTKRLPPKKKKTVVARKSPKSSKTTSAQRSPKAAARASLRNERSSKSLLRETDDSSTLSKKTAAAAAAKSESLRNDNSDHARGKSPPPPAKIENETVPDGDFLLEGSTREALSLSSPLSSNEQQGRSSPSKEVKESLSKQQQKQRSSPENVDSTSKKKRNDEDKQKIKTTNDSQGSLVAAVAANNNNNKEKKSKNEKRAVESSSQKNTDVVSNQPQAKLEVEVSELVSEDHGESVPSNQSKSASTATAAATTALGNGNPSKTDSRSSSAPKESPKSSKKQPNREIKRTNDSRPSPKDKNSKQTNRSKTVSKKNRNNETFVMPVTERQAVLSQKKLGASKSSSSSSATTTSRSRSRRRSTEKPHYATGTEFRRFFERGNHWYSGVIVNTTFVESENAEPSWQYELLFDDHLHMSFHERDDADELDKMLRLSLIRPNSRVAIFWPVDNTFYKATVLREEESRRRGFYIKYDDGEDEWINLWRHEFQILDDVTHQPSLRRQTRHSSGIVSTSQEDGIRKRRRVSDSTVSQKDAPETEEPMSKRKKVEGSHDIGRANRKGSKKKSSRHDAEETETEKSDNEDDSVVEQPPRRKRGRPPKKVNRIMSATFAKGRSNDGNTLDVSDLEDTDEESLNPSPPSPRRKRRKPPKKARSNDGNRSKKFQKENKVAKRGRPKKLEGEKSMKKPGSARGRKPKKVDTRGSDDDSDASVMSVELDPSDDEQAAAVTNKKSVGIEVGCRVSVYWPGEEKFFKATVTKERQGKRRFYIEYDDGDEEWVDFTEERYRILSRSTEGKNTMQGNEAKKKSSMPVTRRHSTESSSPSAAKGEVDVSRIRLNTRVAVWWPDDRRYYKATVTRIQPEANWRPYFLEYDDGDEEWIDLRQHKVRILAGAAGDESASLNQKGWCRDLSRVWIGSRLAVWWPAEEEFFYCTVTRHRDHKRCFYLEYDDGDREWVDLKEHKFYIFHK